MASELYETNEEISEYFKDRKIDINLLKKSTTLYIGNLSFFTSESQIYELFSTCGEVKMIIMGLNKNTKTPCGFCFVEYFTRQDAANAVNLLNNTYLDNRIIRVDWDMGFVEGRQYGRGFSGGQKRDELIDKNDPDRPKDSNASFNSRTTGRKRYRDYQSRDYQRDQSRDYQTRDSKEVSDKKPYNSRRNY